MGAAAHRKESIMTASTFQAAATIVPVRDVGKSVAYYRDVLGFHVEFQYGEPTSYAGLERGSALIHLQAAADTKRQPGQAACATSRSRISTATS
jgi:catechol 2,3-dioxygenase-like lactoylglutathione lyase family enzyme